MREYATQTATLERPAGLEAPATAAQRGLWLTDSLSEHRNGYTVTHAYHLTGHLDQAALTAAIQLMVDRHSALRTRFEMRGETLWQVVDDTKPFDLTVTDMSRTTLHRPIEQVLADRLPERLDLARGPVIRAELVIRSATEHVALLQIHHAVNDAASMAIIEADISAAYCTISAGERYDSPPARQFVTVPRPEVTEQAAAFWRAELAGVRPAKPTEADRAYAGAWESVDCTAEYQAIPGRSTFAYLLAAMHLAVSVQFGGMDNLVGTTVSVRPEGYDDAVGPFVNTLPVRLKIDPQWTGEDIVATAGRALGCVLEHHAVPMEEVAGSGELPVTVTLTSNTAMGPGLALRGLTSRRLDLESRYCQRDLAVYLVRTDDGYQLRACRNVAVVVADVAAGLLRRMKVFLARLVDRPHEKAFTVVASASDGSADQPAADALATVRRAWSEVLGVDERELRQDFFESGGGSLAAMRVAARLGLSVRQMFKLRTQEAIAAVLTARGAAG